MSDTILSVKNLCANYGKSQITFGVSLEVERGEVVALIGRNGVGKTTTLRSIVGLVEKRAGRVEYRGRDVTAMKPYTIARMGLLYVPDAGGVFPNLTVEENFRLSVKKGHFTPEYVYGTFPQVKELRRRRGEQLSGGERRLVGISRGLLANPEMLLIDEPSEGLAPSIVKEIARIITRLKEEKLSMLIADQNLPFVLTVADRIFIMDNGHIKASGAAKELPREIIEKHLAV
ncbi:MAG: ATP-binding cassette domain-containing protein [Deltaproteobacteria bacterium]|nr:ATP-binding cassette domain-containing protein [Deltaproteobacteria bacterium]NIS77649.1 ATP-binding cassette domain-containing protein [Deltaproteobacteria bacterium]